jgi:hypothetical protein
LFPIGCDIEGPHTGTILKPGKLARLHGAKIEFPEILGWQQALHIDQTFAIRREAYPLTQPPDTDLRQFHAGSIGTDGQESRENEAKTQETSRAPQRARPPMQREVDEASSRKPPAAETAKPAITSRGHSARAGDNTMIPSSWWFL